MGNIYFSDAYLEELKTTADPRLTELRDSALRMARMALEEPVLTEEQVTGENEKIYGDRFAAARNFQSAMERMSFGWLYTRDTVYAEKARRMMLNYAEYSKWYGDDFFARGELVTEAFLVGMTEGFLHFGDQFTREELEYLAQRTWELGILIQLEDWMLPGTKVHALDTMGHNWWVVCVASGAMAAIAMGDYLPDGEKLAKIAARGLAQWFAYSGNPINAKPLNWDGGGYYESLNYLNYTMSVYLKFADIYQSFTANRPFADGKILEETADFVIHTHYPSEGGYFVDFGDCGTGVLTALALLHSDPTLNRIRWYLQDRWTVSKEAELLKLRYYHEIWDLPAEKPTENTKIYEKIGWAMLRDSFDRDATMLAVKCGDTWNHAHGDAAHFVLFRKGREEIYDSENSAYSHPLYTSYFCASQAHNVVLFNDRGQDGRDIHTHARCRGQLYPLADEPGFRAITADATGPMSRWFRRHLRHFVWLDGFILIYDDIETYEPGTVNFLLHAEENTCFRMLTPCTHRAVKGYRGHEVQEDTYSAYDQRVGEDCRVKFISLLLLNESLEPELEEIEGGWKLTCGEIRVYLNETADSRTMHRNCIVEMDGITTDATILVKSGSRYGVVNGSIVRENGQSKLDTLARVHGWTDGKLPEWMGE